MENLRKWTQEAYYEATDIESPKNNFVFVDDTYWKKYEEKDSKDFSFFLNFSLENCEFRKFMYAIDFHFILLTHENNTEYYGNKEQDLMLKVEQDPHEWAIRDCRLWVTKVYSYPKFIKKTEEEIQEEKKREISAGFFLLV